MFVFTGRDVLERKAMTLMIKQQLVLTPGPY